MLLMCGFELFNSREDEFVYLFYARLVVFNDVYLHILKPNFDKFAIPRNL